MFVQATSKLSESTTISRKRSFPKIHTPPVNLVSSRVTRREQPKVPRKNTWKPGSSLLKQTIRMLENNIFASGVKSPLYLNILSKIKEDKYVTAAALTNLFENSMVLVAKGYRDSRSLNLPSPEEAQPRPRSPLKSGPVQQSEQRTDPQTEPREDRGVKLQHFQEDKSLKYIVVPGNNGQLIRKLMQERKLWTETSPANSIFNFRWQPLSCRQNFDRLDGGKCGIRQVVNHFEFHGELTNKVKLFLNLSEYMASLQRDVLEVCPLTFVISIEKDSQNSEILDFLHFFLENDPSGSEGKRLMGQYKRLLGTSGLNVKKLKWISEPRRRTAKRTKQVQTEQVSGIQFRKPRSIPAPHKDVFLRKNSFLWLFKPAGENRGRGVQLFSSLDQLERILQGYTSGAAVKEAKKSESGELPAVQVRSQEFVIQKYIERPMLISNRKFDIRVWVLLTHRMGLYFYKEGYLRTSSQPFDLALEDPFVHLTNNAIQRFSSTYGAFENGNQLSFAELELCLAGRQLQLGEVVGEMQDIVRLCFGSVRKSVNRMFRKYSFELFGFDFMLDQTGKAWLIEANTNPCLELSSKLLEGLIPKMLDEMLALTVDRLFPPPGKAEPRREDSGWVLLEQLHAPQPEPKPRHK